MLTQDHIKPFLVEGGCAVDAPLDAGGGVREYGLGVTDFAGEVHRSPAGA